ncbi:ParA family protein [Streptomyces hydrogenans]
MSEAGVSGAWRRLDMALDGVDTHFDYTLIDCQPSVFHLTQMALAAAHDVVIVTEADIYSVEAAKRIYEFATQRAPGTSPTRPSPCAAWSSTRSRPPRSRPNSATRSARFSGTSYGSRPSSRAPPSPRPTPTCCRSPTSAPPSPEPCTSCWASRSSRRCLCRRTPECAQ